MNTFALPRFLIIYGVALPVALLLGYLLATPDSITTMGVVGLVLAMLLLPVFLRWHHQMLVFSWNATIIVFFLPGQPDLWMVLAAGSLLLTILERAMNPDQRLQQVPSVTWPLLFLGLVVIITAKLTGGIGLRSLGGGVYGGRKFYFILAATIGYFALSCRQVPSRNTDRYGSIFFLSGLTSAFPNLIYMAGANLWFLFLIFPVGFAIAQASEDFSDVVLGAKFSRVTGFTYACTALFCYMIVRYGLRGIFDYRRPWRLVTWLLLIAVSMLGGYRSGLIIFGLVFAFQFWLEGLFRTRLFPILALAGILSGAFLVPFVTKLPLSVQRSLSMLPLEIDPAARADAQSSLEWRLEMWKVLLTQVRQYFFLGKGYAIDPADLYLIQESMRRGLAKGFEGAIVSGDYHSGPLSILIPFGIFGLIAFVWFLAAGLRVLYRNYRYGDPSLTKLNTLLLSYFATHVVFYFVGFGSLHSDLALFTGLIGLSVALNHGMRGPPANVATFGPEAGLATVGAV